MTVLPVPVAPPEPMPAESPAPAPPAPGFDHALAHAQRSPGRPDRDTDQRQAEAKTGTDDKDPRVDAPNDDTSAPAAKRGTGDATEPAAKPAHLSDATVAALLAALTGVGHPATTDPTAAPAVAGNNAKPQNAIVIQLPVATAADTPAPPPAPTPTTAPAPPPTATATTPAATTPAATTPAATTPTPAATPAAAAPQAGPPSAPPAAPIPTPPAPAAAANAAPAPVVATASTAIPDATTRPTSAPVAPRAANPAAAAPTVLIAPPAGMHTESTAATATVGDAEAAAPAPPPPPAEQLAAVMRPLQRNSDGSYQIRIELRPPELGRVDLRVELRDGVLHASIHAEHAQTETLVRNALDDLRTRLQNQGVNAGQLTVGDEGTNDRGRNGQPLADAGENNESKAGTEGAVVRTPSTRSDALLDMRI